MVKELVKSLMNTSFICTDLTKSIWAEKGDSEGFSEDKVSIFGTFRIDVLGTFDSHLKTLTFVNSVNLGKISYRSNTAHI